MKYLATIKVYFSVVLFGILIAPLSSYGNGVYKDVEFGAEAFSWITSGFFQEALWSSSESGNEAGEKLLRHQIETALASGHYSFEKSGLAGRTSKAVLLFEGGIKGLFKPTGGVGFKGDAFLSCAGCEIAAYEFDRLFHLNIVPVTVPRNAPLAEGEEEHFGSIQFLLQHEMKPGKGQELAAYLKMIFLDYVSGNSDRHSGNWLVWEEGHRLIAIDHGIAFRTHDHSCEVLKDGHFVGIFKLERDPQTKRLIKGIEISHIFQYLEPELKHRILDVSPEKLKESLDFITVHGGDLELMARRFHNVQLILSGKPDQVVKTCISTMKE